MAGNLSVSRVWEIINSYLIEALKPHTETPFTVEGIVSKVSDNREKNGWYYFDLSDDKSPIRCSVPPEITNDLPVENDKIAIIATFDIYASKPQKPSLGLKVKTFTICGHDEISNLHLQIIKERKSKTTYASKNKIPDNPRKIAIIVPRASVAFDDILSALGDSSSKFELERIDFDGDSIESLLSVLQIADGQKFDLLIIARGGGDGIQIYNNKTVAQTIDSLRTPVITAIGHSTDTTLSDLVATKRVETPFAAGKFLAEKVYAEKVYVSPKPSIPKWVIVLIGLGIIALVLLLFEFLK